MDDDEQYLGLTARILRGEGYDVVTRSLVIGTSSAIRHEQPDMVLIDLNMPLISGDRLAQLIQRSTAHPPVLVLYSGVEEKVLAEQARSCGADAVIPKGMPPRQFLQRVAHLMEGAARRALRTESAGSSPQGQEPRLLVEERFTALLGGHSPEALDREPGAVVGLWPSGRIALQNSAWQRFALDNAGADILLRWPIGSELLSGISGLLRDFYTRVFARVTARKEPWEQCYQCHSPALRREYRLTVLPLERSGLLLVHSHAEVPAPPGAPEPPINALYLTAGGLIHQCSNCRRCQRAGSPGTWDWVPKFVEQPPPNVSHGICTSCRNQYYPGL